MKKILTLVLISLAAFSLGAQSITYDSVSRFELTLTQFNEVDSSFFNSTMEEEFSGTFDLAAASKALGTKIQANPQMRKILTNNGFTVPQWTSTAEKVIGSILYIYMTQPGIAAEMENAREMMSEMGEDNPFIMIDAMLKKYNVPKDIEVISASYDTLKVLMGLEDTSNGEYDMYGNSYDDYGYGYDDYDDYGYGYDDYDDYGGY